MKKNPANRSAFLNSRLLASFAICAICAFLTLLAYALSPGGNAQAAQQQEQQSEQAVPEIPAALVQPASTTINQANVFQGQVASIGEGIPLSTLSPYALAELTGQRTIPLSMDLPGDSSGPDQNRPGTGPAQATATPTPAGAVVLLDTFNGRTVSFTGSVPHTYMGDGFTNATIPGPTTFTNLRSYTFYMIASVVANYTDIHARLALWNGYNASAATEVFSNPNAFFDVDLGPVNITAAPVFFPVTVTVLPPFPFFLGGPNTPWGFSQNFQASTTGGAVADDTNLTSTICYGAPYPAGTILTGASPTFGYYRNASNETNFNFLSSSSRALATVTSQGVGIILRGDPQTGPTPTPVPTATPGTPSPTPSPSITPPSVQCTPREGFDNITNLVSPKGWIMTNNSSPLGPTGWFQGSTAVFTAQAGAATDSYIGANFQNTGALGTISNWLLTPPVTLQNGGWLIFSTRTVDAPAFPDRLQVRMSTNGTSSNVGATAASVGDFTTLLLDINPTYTLTGYPSAWTQFKIQLTGLGLPITGRLAFRYFVESAGSGALAVNSDYIGIDTMSYTCAGATPTPPAAGTATPTPSPSPTIQPTGTPSPTCQPVITLSSSQVGTPGSVSCNNGVGHADNSYWRAFNMNGFTAGAAYNVTSVSFGIESATSNQPDAGTPTPTPGATPQQVTVRLYTQNPGPAFPGGTRTQIATTTVSIPDQSATIFTTPLVVSVPGTASELIMELFTPNGEAQGNTFFIGSNAATQGGPSYLSATDCGITVPTDTAAIGFANMHIIMNVNGSCAVSTVNISGKVGNCSSPTPGPTPVNLPPTANVVMTLTGSSTGSTLTDGTGNYSFTVNAGGTYTVTASKPPLPPAGAGINNVDVLAVQRHFLAIAPIAPGCRLAAADCAGTVGVNNQDVLALQRFFLGFTSGTGNAGQYRFIPASRSYPAIGSNQTNQDYALYVLGDTSAPFANRSEGGPSPDMAAGNDLGFSTVASVSLPELSADQAKGELTAAVTSSVINAQEKFVGFQGDFTFDERVVTFASEPVQNAGITAGNWNVAANVLPGAGPMRILRVSGISNDFAPLSGTGTLFNLKIASINKAGSTPLVWCAAPNNFVFIDADLNIQKPGTSTSGSVNAPRNR